MIFLDSSFVISLAVETDQNHERALEVQEKVLKNEFGSVVLSDYVFDEVITIIFGKTKNIDKTIFVGENLKNSLTTVHINHDLFEESWKLFKNQKNTKFSFTDCSILAVMEKENIKNIATFDGDFKKVKGINVVD